MQLAELTKLYYSIGEVAELFGVAPSLIRYWEAEFPGLHPAKNSRGERKFVVKDIELISQIFHLVKERGFTLEGAKKELEDEKKHTKEKYHLIKRLQSLRHNIEILRNSI